MSRKAIATIGTLSARYPVVSLLLAAALTCLAVWRSTHLRVEMDVAALLPEDSSVAKATRQAMRDFGGYDFLLCLLAVKPEAGTDVQADPQGFLKATRSEVEVALDDQRYFRRRGVAIGMEGEELSGDAAALVALMRPKDFDDIEGSILAEHLADSIKAMKTRLGDAPTTQSLEALKKDPFGVSRTLASRGRIFSGPLQSDSPDGAYYSRDGRRVLIVLWPIGAATDLFSAGAVSEFLEQTKEGLYNRNPAWRQSLDIEFIGPHLENADGATTLQRDVYITSIISLVLVLLLFAVAFRQPEAVLFVAIPLIVGCTWTLGLMGLFVERVTQITLIFAAILIGVGIDFSIHLYNRFVEDFRSGMSVENALQNAVLQTGPSILAGAMSTGFAFAGLALSRFVGFKELGLFGALGTVMCLLSMITILPPLMILFATFAHRMKSPLTGLGLKKVTFTVLSYPRMTVAAGLCVVAYLGIIARDIEFAGDFRELKQPPDRYIRLQEEIDQHFDFPSNQLLAIVEAPDYEKVLEANDILYRNLNDAKSTFNFLSVDSLRSVLPSDVTQRESLQRIARIPVDRIEQRIAELQKSDKVLPPDFFTPSLMSLRALQEQVRTTLATGQMPISYNEVEELLQRYVIHDNRRGVYRVLTRIYPPKGEWFDDVPQNFREQLAKDLPAEQPVLLGGPILNSELKWVILKDLAKVVLLVFGSVLVFLVIYFRSLPRALLALIPVFFSILTVLGAMKLLEIRLNYLNLFAITMLVGVGVDSGIHLLGRFYEDEKRDMRLTIERTGRAIVMTSLTTIFGFGALSFASFPAIREIGIISIIGIFFNLVAALLFLPAVLRLGDPEYTFRGGPGDEIG